MSVNGKAEKRGSIRSALVATHEPKTCDSCIAAVWLDLLAGWLAGCLLACLLIQVLAAVDATPLPPAVQGGDPLLTRLLYDHLIHNRCWATAAALRRDLVQAQVMHTDKYKQTMRTVCQWMCSPVGVPTKLIAIRPVRASEPRRIAH